MKYALYRITAESIVRREGATALADARRTVRRLVAEHREQGGTATRIQMHRCSREEMRTYPVSPNHPEKGSFTRQVTMRYWRPLNDGAISVSLKPNEDAWSMKREGKREAIIAIIHMDDPTKVLWGDTLVSL
jgi:hypothetical protein